VRPQRVVQLLLTGVSAALALSCSTAAAATITEYTSGLTSSSAPYDAVKAPDGNVWFTENGGSGAIGRITPAGVVTEFRIGLTSNSGPRSITVGPDGNLWFTESSKAQIGKITTSGTITEYPLVSGAQPLGIAAGPDGNLWFTDHGSTAAIGRITTTGQVTEYSAGLSSNSSPWNITAGPDGALWFTEHINSGKIGRIATDGTISEYSGATGVPTDITQGPDGNLWFTESSNPGAIGKITPTGTISEYAVITANQTPTGIAAGGDGRLYFTEKSGTGALGAITTTGAVTEYTTGLTTSSGPMGIAAGGDGDVWFTESAGTARFGRLTAPPGASTGSATAITNIAATLVGTVTPATQATTYSFQYGLTTSYGSQTATTNATATAGTAQTVSAEASGLSATTTYHYRLVATNASGTTYGADQTFTTSSVALPAAYTAPATGTGATSATLGGTVNPNGRTTTYHFEWGTTTAYGHQAPAVDPTAGSDSTDHQVPQTLSGLSPATTYHYHLVATNSFGTTVGSDQTFTTAGPPTAVTGDAGAVTASGAALSGTLNPGGVATTYRFEWGTTTTYGGLLPSPDAPAGSDRADHPVKEALSGLAAGTTYHFRLVATNEAGTTYGADHRFTTAATPVDDGPTDSGPDAGGDRAAAALPDPGDPAPADQPAPKRELPAPGRPVAGRSVNVAPAAGTVTVRLPGTNRDLALGAAGSRVPVGSVVDASRGQITLTTALDSRGHVQEGTFWGGRFVVAQEKGPKITLTLANKTTGCPTHAASAAMVAPRKRRRDAVLGRLWGSDHHGSFRTIGRSAAATVRGTRWLTEDRCDGTLVRVVEGAVVVTDKRTHRQTLVRAGQQKLVARR